SSKSFISKRIVKGIIIERISIRLGHSVIWFSKGIFILIHGTLRGKGSIQNNFQRDRDAQLLINHRHALINFTVIMEVIDKPVFYVQAGDAKHRCDSKRPTDSQYFATMMFRHLGKRQSDCGGLIAFIPWRTFW